MGRSGMSALSQQAAAVETAARIISGAALKPSPSERTYLIERLRQAAETLRIHEQQAAE